MTPTTAPLPAVPPEVAAFAAEAGVTAYLPGVLEAVRGIFPAAKLTILVEDDPEIADDRHIVLEVEAGDREPEEVVGAYQLWARLLFQHCPSTHAPVFRLGIV